MRIPGEHDKSSPLVRLDDLPHEGLKFKQRVGDVEDRQKPCVLFAGEAEVLVHAGDFGIAIFRSISFPASFMQDDEPNVTSVEERK